MLLFVLLKFVWLNIEILKSPANRKLLEWKVKALGKYVLCRTKLKT